MPPTLSQSACVMLRKSEFLPMVAWRDRASVLSTSLALVEWREMLGAVENELRRLCLSVSKIRTVLATWAKLSAPWARDDWVDVWRRRRSELPGPDWLSSYIEMSASSNVRCDYPSGIKRNTHCHPSSR